MHRSYLKQENKKFNKFVRGSDESLISNGKDVRNKVRKSEMPRNNRQKDSTFTFDASRNEGFRYSTKIQNMQTYNTVQDNIFVHESTTDSQASFIFESDEETGQKVKRRPWETI